MRRRDNMVAPFPYPGGKSRVAPLVWRGLGSVDAYFEPFFGSGAVLLQRPNYNVRRHFEIVNDKDGLLANVWRAIKFEPEQTARWCDWPISHVDLIARKRDLQLKAQDLTKELEADPQYCDPVLAGYWIWILSSEVMATPGKVNVNRTRPGFEAKGIHSRTTTPQMWIAALSERLRNVRIMCGDWSIVCNANWPSTHWNKVGYFLDPPYDLGERSEKLYRGEIPNVAKDVKVWAIERGALPDYRIVIAGFDTEHGELENYGWRVESWKTSGGYALVHSSGRGIRNAGRERLWFSPHCINEGGLFPDERVRRRRA